jgi:hypothetical protein
MSRPTHTSILARNGQQNHPEPTDHFSGRLLWGASTSGSFSPLLCLRSIGEYTADVLVTFQLAASTGSATSTRSFLLPLVRFFPRTLRFDYRLRNSLHRLATFRPRRAVRFL